MKTINKQNWLFLLSILLLISGCLPYNPSERVAVVIFNDTDSSVSYQLHLSNKWTLPTKIESKQFNYVLEYDQMDKHKGVTNQLNKIKIITINCKFTLDRKDIVKHMKKDPEGRNTWDLHVNELLLKQFKCN